MKKIKIIALVVIFYLFIGYFISLLGMSNDLSFSEKLTSTIIVMIGWPMFLIGKIIYHF